MAADAVGELVNYFKLWRILNQSLSPETNNKSYPVELLRLF